MSKFEWKVENQTKSWYSYAKRWELIRILKFEEKIGNRWKCCNLSVVRIDKNVEIWVKTWNQTKSWHSYAKGGNRSEYWFLRKKLGIRNWTEYWNIETEYWNLRKKKLEKKKVEIWEKKKLGINENVVSRKSNKKVDIHMQKGGNWYNMLFWNYFHHWKKANWIMKVNYL